MDQNHWGLRERARGKREEGEKGVGGSSVTEGTGAWMANMDWSIKLQMIPITQN